MSSFGEKIKSLREEKQLSTKDLAQSIGIPQSRYSELEKGIRIPTGGQVERIEQFFEISPGELGTLVKQ